MTHVNKLFDTYPQSVIEFVVAQNADRISHDDYFAMLTAPAYGWEPGARETLVLKYAPVDSPAFEVAAQRACNDSHKNLVLSRVETGFIFKVGKSLVQAASYLPALEKHIDKLDNRLLCAIAENLYYSSYSGESKGAENAILALERGNYNDATRKELSKLFVQARNNLAMFNYTRAVIGAMPFEGEQFQNLLQQCLRGDIYAGSILFSLIAMKLDLSIPEQAKLRKKLLDKHMSLPQYLWVSPPHSLVGITDEEARLFLGKVSKRNNSLLRFYLAGVLTSDSELLPNLFEAEQLRYNWGAFESRELAKWALKVFSFDELMEIFANKGVSLVVRKAVVEVSEGVYSWSQIGQLAGAGLKQNDYLMRRLCLLHAPVDSDAFKRVADTIKVKPDEGELLAIYAGRTSLSEMLTKFSNLTEKQRREVLGWVKEFWVNNYEDDLPVVSQAGLAGVFQMVADDWADYEYCENVAYHYPAYLSSFLPFVSAENEELRAVIAQEIQWTKEDLSLEPRVDEQISQLFDAEVPYDLSLFDEEFTQNVAWALS